MAEISINEVAYIAAAAARTAFNSAVNGSALINGEAATI